MIWLWRALRQAKLLPAVLVGVAMLLAPLANARPMPCHDHDEPAAHTDVAHVSGMHTVVMDDAQHVVTPDHGDHSGEPSQVVDHGKCCAVACGVHAMVIGSIAEDVLDPTFARQHFDLIDQVARGLTVPPALDPPRFQA